MNENIDAKSVLLDFLIMYKGKVFRKLPSNDDDEVLCKKRIINDIENINKYIMNKIIYNKKKDFDYTYELFSCEDINNMYELNEEIYYKNMKSSNFKYLQEVSIVDDSFEYFVVKIRNSIIIGIEFIFNFTPLVDLLYRYCDDLNTNQIIEKYFEMFNIKNYENFQQNMDENYNIAVVS
jgi:hypothetical protein